MAADEEGASGGRGAAMLATDLGGTRMRAAIYDAAGQQRHHDAGPTRPDDPSTLARAMRAAVEASPLPVAGAVVGIAGPIDYDRGVPRALPNLPVWEGQISAQGLADAVGVPVILANDADLAALGEQRFGAGVGAQDVVYVTASTGVGGGVVLRGRLLHSRYSLAEIGHTVIDRTTGESVEQLGSGTALARLSGDDPAAVSARAAAGDAQAAALFRDVADAFALGVLNLALAFMPERVVIGGGMSQAGELLLGPVRERIAAGPAVLPLRPEDVVLATGGDDVGLRGAYALWLDLTDPAQPMREFAMVAPSQG
jgi:glucokinase